MSCDKIFEIVIFFLAKNGSKKILEQWKNTENLKSFELLFLKNIETWKPIEGLEKKKDRKGKCNINTKFSIRRADHRNTILKDWEINCCF
jgi:hypothetical protein